MYIGQNRYRGSSGGDVFTRDVDRIESRQDVALARRGALDLRDYRRTPRAQGGGEVARLGCAPRLGNDGHGRHDFASRADFDAFGGVDIIEYRAHLSIPLLGGIPLLARRSFSRTSSARLEATISRAMSTPCLRDGALPPR